MRLNPFNTSKIRVRSSGSGSAGGSRMPGGKGGGIGCGTLVIVAIAYFVFGADPMQTLSTVQGIDGATSQPSQQSSTDEAAICGRSEYAREACDALTSLNETWEAEFAKAGIPFKDPMLDLFTSGRVSTEGCGDASSASGPFYCPADMGIYIDTGFYEQLANMAGTGGDFARLYVIAHEYGHHIQNLTGLAEQVRSAQAQNPRRSNELQVRMELQADCYAGVWAGKNRNQIEAGDMEEGLRAAASIGDDTLQKRAGQRINPEGFTHGTSAQRMEALKLGLESADDSQCDRYFQFN